MRLVYCLYIYNIGYTPVRQDQLLSSYCQGSSVSNAGDTLLIVPTGNKTNNFSNREIYLPDLQ